MVIGIIGGGQLGMMMAEAAKKYNHKIIGLDPDEKCSLSHFADKMLIANYNDKNAFQELVRLCDVITYEFENVDLKLIKEFEYKIPQKAKALYYSRNRLVEKEFAQNLHIPTPKFEKLTSTSSIIPAIIKTTTGGYDGKGQWRITSKKQIDQILNETESELIIEELVAFDYEISVIMTRDQFGNVSAQPIPINYHRNGILHMSVVTDEIDLNIKQKALQYTTQIIESLDYVGTLAVEYFVKGDEVLFNEFAPRTHNSGHYSIEGSTLSQFENHILAVTGIKVEPVRYTRPTIMINVLGQDYDYIKTFNGENTYLHMYMKDEKKKDRKMGHITILKDSVYDIYNIRNTLLKEQA
jgi:5-(carboxyamino)imidazole ribonucleotide synthase